MRRLERTKPQAVAWANDPLPLELFVSRATPEAQEPANDGALYDFAMDHETFAPAPALADRLPDLKQGEPARPPPALIHL